MAYRGAKWCALPALMLLASCAHQNRVAVGPAKAPRGSSARPVLPASLAAVMVPPTDDQGRYRTINYGIDPVQTEWHVRAALNVAALGCRGTEHGGIIPAYNSLLKKQKAELAVANRTVEERFRKAGGKWQAAHDAYMTRLYNFFAQPAGQAGFCAAADSLAPQAAKIGKGGFRSFAASALPRLEAPFIETYRQVDAYRAELATWQSGRQSPQATSLAYRDTRRRQTD